MDSKLIRFVLRDTERMAGVDPGSEDGIPPHTPYRTVDDAPSAFAGQTLKVIAPAAWPANLPIPMAAKLVNGANETVPLNGLVTFGGFPSTPVLMRRGWGSVVAPAKTTAGLVALGASLNSAPVFTDISGVIAANTAWPANSRINVTGTLTVGAGASWGGIERPTSASLVSANWTLFHGSGEEQDCFTTHTGYTTHELQQALFLVSGTLASGSATGAHLQLTDCFCFSIAGQAMNSKAWVWTDLSRTLLMRAVTCGEQNDCKVTIDRCALLEFPSETSAFADADNDAIYLTSGDLSVTNSVIGFTKDDGIDSGETGARVPSARLIPPPARRPRVSTPRITGTKAPTTRATPSPGRATSISPAASSSTAAKESSAVTAPRPAVTGPMPSWTAAFSPATWSASAGATTTATAMKSRAWRTIPRRAMSPRIPTATRRLISARLFNVADKSQIASLGITLRYDDGGIVYLNGTLVAATAGMPVDPAYNYFLGGTAPPDNSILTATTMPASLVNGTNTIAVEIHQQSGASSDISFDLQLTAVYVQPFELHLSRAGGQPILYWFDSAATLEATVDFTLWTLLPAGTSPFPFGTAVPREFFRLRK